jgi:hypothetical protein
VKRGRPVGEAPTTAPEPWSVVSPVESRCDAVAVSRVPYAHPTVRRPKSRSSRIRVNARDPWVLGFVIATAVGRTADRWRSGKGLYRWGTNARATGVAAKQAVQPPRAERRGFGGVAFDYPIRFRIARSWSTRVRFASRGHETRRSARPSAHVGFTRYAQKKEAKAEDDEGAPAPTQE